MRRRTSPKVLAERRRAPRIEAEHLELAYWNGSKGVLRRIRDVSCCGAFVETSDTRDRWFAATVMEALLVAKVPLPAQIPESAVPQIPGRNDAAHGMKTTSFRVTAKVVRHVPEGICVEFISGGKTQLRALEDFLLAAGRKEADSRRQSNRGQRGATNRGATNRGAPRR